MQFGPSAKAECIKLWPAQVGYERLQALADCALSLTRRPDLSAARSQRQADRPAHDRVGNRQHIHREAVPNIASISRRTL